MAQIVGNLDQELEGFFRSKPGLRLRVTTTDSEGVLDAVVPHYQFADNTLPLPARRHGSGLVSLQRVLLLLHFGRQRAADGQNFWLALEEPELHVPPPLQRRLVSRVQALSAQTFISTHSPSVATLAEPTTVTFLRNEHGMLSAVPLQRATPRRNGQQRPETIPTKPARYDIGAHARCCPRARGTDR
jgi:putative ATP-dependent endonuclease of OLD family